MKGFYLVILFVLFEVCVSNLQALDETQILQSDAEISHKLVGTWTEEVEMPEFSLKVTNTFASDSTFVTVEKSMEDGHEKTETYWGTWQVKDAILTATVTNAIGITGKPQKFLHHGKIIRLNEKDLLIQVPLPTGKPAIIFTYKRK